MESNNNQKLIQGLQAIVTGLSQQADGHTIQSRIFASHGLTKLAEKYAEHASEERGYVEKCINRILDLSGSIENQAKQQTPVYNDAIEFIKYDLQVSKEGLPFLKTIMDLAKDDYTTFDMLKDYYQDEEEDLYWSQQQLELIDLIGKQNWLIRQL